MASDNEMARLATEVMRNCQFKDGEARNAMERMLKMQEGRFQNTDCWLDRQGRTYNVEPFGHEKFAEKYLASEFDMRDIQDWEKKGFSLSFENTLSKRGWARFTTTSRQWVYDPSVRLTKSQLETIYQLGGRISRYEGYPFMYEEYERV